MDLNADVGERETTEGLREDGALLEQITSANIACGGHAGGPTTMSALCAAAAAGGVRIGAHVGYADREGFGRRDLELTAAEIGKQTADQVALLQEAAAAEGSAVVYVKPHGALYRRCLRDAQASIALVAAVQERSVRAIVGSGGSELLRAAAAAGLMGIREGFADRAYAADGRLVGRERPGAVLETSQAQSQARALATGAPVPTVDGPAIVLIVDSICLHSDTPGAVATARRVRDTLAQAGVDVRPFK